MGLDQYWEQQTPDSKENHQLFYHRKFNALEGFMAQKWAKETGQDAGEFNCQNLTITSEILDELEEAIENDKLNPVAGFFFGTTDKDEWYNNDVTELRIVVIPKIRKKLEEGETITYSSWW